MITVFVQLLFPYAKERKVLAKRIVLGLQNDLDLAFDWIFFNDVFHHKGTYILPNMTCEARNWPPYQNAWYRWEDYYADTGCTGCDLPKECDPAEYRRVLKALLAFCVFGTISWLMLASDGRLFAAVWRLVGIPSFSTAHILTFSILFEDIPQIVLSVFIDLKYRSEVSAYGIINVMTAAYSLVNKIAEAVDSREEKYDSGLGWEEEYKHDKGCVSSVLRADEERFLTGCTDNKVRLWNVKMPEKSAYNYEGHSGPVNAIVMVGPNMFLSGSSDSTLKLWHLESQQNSCLIRTYAGHRAGITSLALINESIFVSGSHDRTAKLWNIDSGECLRTFELHGRIASVAKASSTTFLTMSVSRDQCARLWSVTDESKSLASFGGKVASAYLCFRPGRLTTSGRITVGSVIALDNRSFIVGSRKGWVIWEWDSRTGTCNAVRAIQQSNVSKAIICFWPIFVMMSILDDILFLKLFRSLFDLITSIAIADENRLVTVSGNGTIRVMNLWTGECINRYSGGIVPKTSVATLKANKFVTGSWDGTAKLWSTKFPSDPEPKWLMSLRHEGRVMSAIEVIDGHMLLTGCADNKTRLWNAATGHCVRTYEGHEGFVGAIAMVLPEGGRFLTGSSDSTIMLWYLEPQREGDSCHIRTYAGHEGTVTSIACVDESTFVSGSHDKSAKLWSFDADVCLRTFKHGKQRMKDRLMSVSKVAEASFATTSVDQCVRVWNIGDDTTPMFETTGDLWFSPFLTSTSCSDSLALGSSISLNETNFVAGCRNGAKIWREGPDVGWYCAQIFMPAPLNVQRWDKVLICLGVVAAFLFELLEAIVYLSLYLSHGTSSDIGWSSYASPSMHLLILPAAGTIYIGFCLYVVFMLGNDAVVKFVEVTLALPLIGLAQAVAWNYGTFDTCGTWSYTNYWADDECVRQLRLPVGVGASILCLDIISAMLLIRFHYIWVSKIGNLWKKGFVAAAILLPIAVSFAPRVPFSSFDLLVSSVLLFGAWYYSDWYFKDLLGKACVATILLLLALSFVPLPWMAFAPFDVLVSTLIIGFVYFWTSKIKRKGIGTALMITMLVAMWALLLTFSRLSSEPATTYYSEYYSELYGSTVPLYYDSLHKPAASTFVLGMTLIALYWFFVLSIWLDWVTSVSMAGEDNIVTVSRSGHVRLWDINTGKCIHHIVGEGIPITSVVASCDEFGVFWFLVGSWDRTAKVSRWDRKNDGESFRSAVGDVPHQ